MYLLSQMRNTLQETAYNLPYVGRKNRHLFNYFLYLWNTFYTFSLLLSLIMFLVTIATFPTLGLNHKGINLRWCKKPVPACLYPFQQGRVSAHSFLPGFLLHLTKRDGVMPDFSYDKGDDGIMDNKAGWLKQFSSPSPPLTEQCNSNQRDFQEFLGQIIGKLLGLYCGFFFVKYIVPAHKVTCNSGGSMPPGNTTLPMEKSQFDVNRNTLFRLMAEIQLY